MYDKLVRKFCGAKVNSCIATSLTPDIQDLTKPFIELHEYQEVANCETSFGHQDIIRFLEESGVCTESLILELAHPANSATETAELLGVSLECVLKCIALMVCESPLLVILSGNCNISMTLLAKALKVHRQSIRFASENECQSMFGYAPANISPIFHRHPSVNVVIDSMLFDFVSGIELDEANPELNDSWKTKVFYGKAGSLAHIIRVSPSLLLQCTECFVAEIAQKSGRIPKESNVLQGQERQDNGGLESDVSECKISEIECSMECIESRIEPVPLKFMVDGTLGRLMRWYEHRNKNTIFE